VRKKGSPKNEEGKIVKRLVSYSRLDHTCNEANRRPFEGVITRVEYTLERCSAPEDMEMSGSPTEPATRLVVCVEKA
jgi:hypothetical protein